MAGLVKDLRKLVPLLSVFSAVAMLTLTITFFRADYSLMSVGKTFMAMFFLVFGSFKLYNIEGFKMAFQEYDPLAMRSSGYATIYPFLELSLAFSYLAILFYSLPGVEPAVYIATIVLMVLNASGVAEALYRGRHLQCACLGNVFNVPMTTVTLTEDLLMAGMALYMLLL